MHDNIQIMRPTVERAPQVRVRPAAARSRHDAGGRGSCRLRNIQRDAQRAIVQADIRYEYIGVLPAVTMNLRVCEKYKEYYMNGRSNIVCRV